MRPADPEARTSRKDATLVATVAIVSVALAAMVRLGCESGFGARGPLSPTVFCWILVAGGIAGTFVVSSGGRSGWLFLFGLQPFWIAYALVTGQAGLIVGCVFSAAAHVNGFVRRDRQRRPRGRRRCIDRRRKAARTGRSRFRWQASRSRCARSVARTTPRRRRTRWAYTGRQAVFFDVGGAVPSEPVRLSNGLFLTIGE